MESPRIAKILFHTKVAGVSHSNDDGISRQEEIELCVVGDPLSLVREPENPYDAEAVGVWTTRPAQIGYLSRDCADDIAPIIDSGAQLWAEITDLTGGIPGKPTRGVNVAIFQAVSAPDPTVRSATQAPPRSIANPYDASQAAMASYAEKIREAYKDGFVSPAEIHECRRHAAALLKPEEMKAAHAQILAQILDQVSRDGVVSSADEHLVSAIRKLLDVLGWSP